MSTVEPVRSSERPWIARRWPAIAGIAMAAFAAYGIDSGADVAPIVTASAFVYLGSAALQRRTAAWPVFAVSFVVVGVGSNVDGVNATWVMVALAAVLAVYGVIRGALRPSWGLPLQAGALVVLAAAALVAVEAKQTLARSARGPRSARPRRLGHLPPPRQPSSRPLHGRVLRRTGHLLAAAVLVVTFT